MRTTTLSSQGRDLIEVAVGEHQVGDCVQHKGEDGVLFLPGDTQQQLEFIEQADLPLSQPLEMMRAIGIALWSMYSLDEDAPLWTRVQFAPFSSSAAVGDSVAWELRV